jgi:MOSC domain-containing protein YiiM
MKIISVNVGLEQAIRGKSGTSGIFKQPTSDPVMVHSEGLTKDVIIDTENHGGVDQAVYIYGEPDYMWWSNELQQDLKPGIFGENITISDLESRTLCIGDRLEMGSVVLEVTSPRIPCVTLATRMNDPKFVKKFVKAERYGAYCRVIQVGEIQIGNAVTLIEYEGTRLSINSLADAFYNSPLENKKIKLFLSLPIDIRTRTDYEAKLKL